MANSNKSSKVFDVRVKNKIDTLENFVSSDILLYKGELALAIDDKDMAIYVGDGVKTFTQLEPLFSTKMIVGIDRMLQNVVQLQPNAWVNNEQIVEVPGVSNDEQSQLIIPTFAQASRQACLSAGIDYYVTADAKICFTCVKVPSEVLTIYVGIFGAQKDGDSDKPVIRTEIDANLSTESENPVMNKIITAKIDSIEAVLRGITGDESGSDNTTSLPAISNTLNNTISYSNTPTKVGTLTVDGGTTKEEIDRIVIPFNITVNRENLNPDSDISSFAINNSQTINMEKLTNAYWTGKSSTGSFFGSCPIIIDNTGKINLISVPVSETAYTLNGIVTVEYV